MDTIEVTLALLLAIAIVGALAKWVPLPGPLLLVVGGVLLSFVPLLSNLHIEPEIFFALFIPPLLFADGWLIPKRDFLSALRPVLLLAFGLVFLTVVAVGYVMHWLIPDLPLAAAFALGAIVSPTDAVATAATTERLQVPSRITNILNGESLINDASGLVAFKFAVAAVATGFFSLVEAAGQFVLLAGGGSLAGLAVAWLVGEFRVRLTRFCVDDPTIQTTLSLLTPFAAYLAAESLHTSGILAVVVAGLYAGAHDARHISTATRQHSWEVWRMLLYAFNGLVFLLLGLELRGVLEPHHRHLLAGARALRDRAVGRAQRAAPALGLSGGASAAATFAPDPRTRRVSRSARHFPRRVGRIARIGDDGGGAVDPAGHRDGTPFPGRDLIIFLAGTTIVLTLVINGLTLPWLIRFFGVHGDGNAQREERAARIALAQAASNALRESLPKLKRAEEIAVAQRLIDDYERQLHRHSANANRRADLDTLADAERKLRLAALRAERAELQEMREADVINDETARSIEAEIDHAESFVAPTALRSHG